MKGRMLVLVMLASALLAGCATTQKVRSDVTVFQEWPADMRGKSIAFEETGAQANNLEYRTYENMVRNALHQLGFVDAPNDQAAQIKVSMEYGIKVRDVRVVQPVLVDPGWGPPYWPYYRPRWGYPRYYSPFYDPFWPDTAYEEENFQVYTRRLHVVLSRASDNKKLYDVTVLSDGQNASLPAVMPYLVQSAFADFPAANGTTRTVELDMKK